MVEGQNAGDAPRLAQLRTREKGLHRRGHFQDGAAWLADPVQHRLPLRIGAVDPNEDRVPLRVGPRVDQNLPHSLGRGGDPYLDKEGLAGGERARHRDNQDNQDGGWDTPFDEGAGL